MPKTRAYRDRLPVSAREILGEFFLAYGHEITNALAGQADLMRQAAADAGARAAQPDPAPEPQKPSCSGPHATDGRNQLYCGATPVPASHLEAPRIVTLHPTQGGFTRTAAMFTEAAGTADAARRAFEELCGEYDDEENT